MDQTSKIGSRRSSVSHGLLRNRGLALAAVIAAVALLTLTLRLVGSETTDASNAGPNTQRVILPPPPQGQPTVTATVKLDPGVTDIGVGHGAVWASTANGVIRIDPRSNEVAATIPVDGIGDSGKLAIGEDAVWVTHDASTVSRIDPATDVVVAEVSVGPGVAGIAAGGGSVWVTRQPPDEVEGHLVRIDPTTNQVVGSPIVVGAAPGPVSYAGGAVWVTLKAESGTLVKVDTTSMTVVHEIEGVRGSSWSVGNEVWAATGTSILRIEPSSGTVLEEIPFRFSTEIDFGSDAAWVLSDSPATGAAVYIPDPRSPATVVEVDPTTGQRVGAPVPIGVSPAYLAAGEGAVWAAQYDSGVVTRIDPKP